MSARAYEGGIGPEIAIAVVDHAGDLIEHLTEVSQCMVDACSSVGGQPSTAT